MSLFNLDLKKEYRNLRHDVIGEFYIPALKEAIMYKRAVGFFNSAALYEIAIGLNQLVKNNGKIRLIVSPKLNKEDIEEIQLGYQKRKEIIARSIVRELYEPETRTEKKRLNLLANLIAENVLDIKIAFKLDANGVGIFHEKMGLIEDSLGYKVAFSGSMNETHAGLLKNYEAIDVFCSWCPEDIERVKLKERAFDCLWNNLDGSIEVLDFPQVAVEILEKFKEKTTEQIFADEDFIKVQEVEAPFFRIPQGKGLRTYQEDAINAWAEQGYCGIFDMATGTGKTYTALGALSTLSKHISSLAVVIVCPYQHLVEQWVEDIELFGVQPIVAYSSYKNWKELFSDTVNAYRVGVQKNFCIITTNGTFETDSFQKILKRIKTNLCFVVDEAHNFGATKLSTMLPENSFFRLGLSATIERFRDDEGTAKLYNFFGEKCISFPLERAISEGCLTRYKYYPVVVNLTTDELDEYRQISKKIAKMGGATPENCERNPTIELLLLKRARIVAGAQNKVIEFIKKIEPYKNESHMLVYCGATKYDRTDIDDSCDIKQIDLICKQLSCVHNMKVRKFTSDEDKKERQRIKDDFIEGDSLQIIAAIKCLDEGVNIPAIKRAFILASSTNPKEYIQRRGRVLRTFEGKDFSEIFDFITLPRPLSETEFLDSDEIRIELSLIRKEFERMMDFANTAMNPLETDELKELIQRKYGMYDLNLEDEIYG